MDIKQQKMGGQKNIVYFFNDITFCISYNDFTDPEIRELLIPDSVDETAIVLIFKKENHYLILNGDHRENYFALGSKEECINYFLANKHQRSSRSNLYY